MYIVYTVHHVLYDPVLSYAEDSTKELWIIWEILSETNPHWWYYIGKVLTLLFRLNRNRFNYTKMIKPRINTCKVSQRTDIWRADQIRLEPKITLIFWAPGERNVKVVVRCCHVWPTLLRVYKPRIKQHQRNYENFNESDQERSTHHFL